MKRSNRANTRRGIVPFGRHSPTIRFIGAACCGWLAAMGGCAHSRPEAARNLAGGPAAAFSSGEAHQRGRGIDDDGPAHRVGSRPSRESPSSPELTADQRAALAEVIEEIEAIEGLSLAERIRLIDDLKAADAKLWPQMVQVYKATLAYRRQLEQAAAAQAPTADRPGDVAPAGDGLASAPETVQTAAHGVAGDQVARQPALISPAAADARPLAAAQQPAAGDGAAQTVAQAGYAEPLALGGSPGGARQRTEAGTTILASAERALLQPQSSEAPSGTPGMAPAAQSAEAGFQQHLQAAIASLEQAAPPDSQSAEAVARQQQLRLLYLVAGRREEALRPIAGLPQPQQEFWTNELFGLMTLADAASNPDAGRRATQAAPHLQTALARLSGGCELVVRSLAFCTEVRSYGVYKAFEEYLFDPGQEVLLYAELDHFQSNEHPEGYHTALKSSYEIYDAEGRRVAQQDFPLTEEYCRRHRRDFFIRYFINLPSQQLYPGRHTLRLTIEDTLAHKVGQGSIEFTVKAK